MAYADKITTMRRMALHKEPSEKYSGNIEYEGVDIEGDCLLKEVSYIGTTVVVLSGKEELEAFCQQNNLVVKYQDPDDEDSWEPRTAKEETSQ